MCGINGYLAKSDSAPAVTAVLEKMNTEIVHRGPDQDGFFVDTNGNCAVGMAMRRLSIIDLGSGKQPITTADGQKIIVFNGEIYNYRELKSGLSAMGVAFDTQSDTEVLLKLYEQKGVEAFSMLDGMFAFSIYDKSLGKVFIGRDFFGEKPLYYTHTGSEFIWASELKSIMPLIPRPEIDKRALNLFLQLTYIPAPYSIYSNVFKLEANSLLVFDCKTFSFEISQIRQDFKTIKPADKAQATKMTHDLVQESVQSRSIADVPLGTFLSGGVDSSIVSLCLAHQSGKKIDTFSIGFDKKSFDETDKSRTVAKLIGSNHHEFVISGKDLSANRDAILLNFDEPFADSSALATYVVANKTREFVTVALTGDGGDEVFGGYNKYYMGRLNERYTQLVPKRLHGSVASAILKLLRTSDDKRGLRFKISRLLKAINYDGDFYYNIISLGFTQDEVKQVLQAAVFVSDPLSYYKDKIGDKVKTLTDFRNIDKILSLEGDMLVKVDRTSMLTSLECRAPFLNKTLWNFTSQLPESYLISGWDKKHLLKEAFKQYFPKGFLDKSKMGFGVPVGDWLRTELKGELLSYTDRTFIIKQNLFNYDQVEHLVANHLSGKIDNTFRVWTFFCFQKWYKHAYGA